MEQDIATLSTITHLYCPSCNKQYSIYSLQTFATCCNQPLLSAYNTNQVSKEAIDTSISSMWRYAALLPLLDESNLVSLGEGWTPTYNLSKTAGKLSIDKILLKDEALNPTGSFKARGISAAVSKAKELDIAHIVIPTAGNAGGALSAYAAKAGIAATVIMPKHTSETLKEECRLYGAELILLDGLIDACGKKAGQLKQEKGYFDMSTLKEPYRLEGKKTLGYEIAEQLNWQLPDVIIYPTGGGTGLIGMWKAFGEMREMGWINGKLPRMVVVQTENCNPMIQALQYGAIPDSYIATPSKALGLAVPRPFAKDLILEAVRTSNGTAICVSEDEMEQGIHEIASSEGILLSPEGSATYMGLKKLIEKDWVKEDETVLLFNTGSWYKYR
ncbi:threonine synthase [Parasediminibacterium sp. JCM 36343]|uniref:threonine synthase n=1 Tax=Parasediminibacterium sp. JCM 36343 TaxID=3374279 RepID=UPI00397C452A